MVYGDLQFFDIIVFAGVALFLIYRLRNVLGKRGGFEKKRLHNPPQEKESEQTKKTTPQLKDNEAKLSLVSPIGFPVAGSPTSSKYSK